MQTRNHFWSQLAVTMLTLVGFALVAAVPVANSQKQSVRSSAHAPSTKEPLYSEYRGARVGMKAQEVRVKLGEPLQKADDMDLYSFSEKRNGPNCLRRLALGYYHFSRLPWWSRRARLQRCGWVRSGSKG